MAEKTQCHRCEKVKGTVKCCGCSQAYCYNHFDEHRQELSRKLEEVTVSRDYLLQTLVEQKDTMEKHVLIQKLEEWERLSIEKIRQAADEIKKSLLKRIHQHFVNTEGKLNYLTLELRKSHEENDFHESDLQRWEEKLAQLKEDINRSSIDIVLRPSIPLVHQIDIDTTSEYTAQKPLTYYSISLNVRDLQSNLRPSITLCSLKHRRSFLRKILMIKTLF